MTTFSWSANTLTAPWNDPNNWTPVGSPASGRGEVALIGYGTIDLGGTAECDIATTLQPVLHAFGVKLAAADVDFGDNSTLTIAPPATPGQPIVLDIIGDGSLDDGGANPALLSPQTGTIDFAAVGTSLVNLTLELSAGLGVPAAATFTNNGVMHGEYLTVTADPGTFGTFVNNTVLDVTGGLTIDSGVTLGGSGAVELDGSFIDASIGGAVDQGQTIAFLQGVQNTLTIGDIVQFHGVVDITHESQVVVQGVSLSSVSNDEVTFSDGSTLDIVPTGSGGNVVAETVDYYNAQLGEAEPATLIDATESGLPCFCTGTRIATDDGEMPVEAVSAGTIVRLAGGGTARVVWVGHRDMRCDRHKRPHDVRPVRIAASAMAPGVPLRDLRLSPDHAVVVAGHLIPVRHLFNGASIVQQPAALVRYHHVELARHDLLLAEGLAAESYLDTGNRGAFAASGSALALHPDFARNVWSEEGCAPLVEDGPALAMARRVLLRQAARLGHRRTRDPALRLLADGRGLRTVSVTGGWHVPLPPDVRQVRLLSRTWVPAEMRPDENDTRRLGIAIGRLWLDGREVGLDSPALTRGWHVAEPGTRWTDGDATLEVAGARMLGFTVTMAGSYWRDAAAGARRRA